MLLQITTGYSKPGYHISLNVTTGYCRFLQVQIFIVSMKFEDFLVWSPISAFGWYWSILITYCCTMLDQRLLYFGNLETIYCLDNILILEKLHFFDDIDKCINCHILRYFMLFFHYSDFYKLCLMRMSHNQNKSPTVFFVGFLVKNVQAAEMPKKALRAFFVLFRYPFLQVKQL